MPPSPRGAFGFRTGPRAGLGSAHTSNGCSPPIPRGTRHIGQRTGFAFFIDEAHRRKILVAVNGKQTDRNHYYDGPFDQLPDNHPDTGIRSYIERSYPFTSGHVGPYGGYVGRDSRVLIFSYDIYYERSQLSFVEDCVTEHSAGGPLYSCVAKDFAHGAGGPPPD